MILEAVSKNLETLKSLESYDPATSKFWLAFSGGVDSAVLLDLLCKLGYLPEVIHVNHQILPEAPAWVEFTKIRAQAYGLNYHLIEIDPKSDPHLKAQGLEAVARNLRYKAFEDLLNARLNANINISLNILLFAHHAQDQAETIFFRLLRGTGIQGLAGIPMCRPLNNQNNAKNIIFRPLLNTSKAEILAYAKAQNLPFVEDPSNQDLSLSRNFLRQSIFPQLETRWPGFSGRIAALAQDIAASDDLGDLNFALSLSFSDLKSKDSALQKKILRAWIHKHNGQYPERAVINRLLAMLQSHNTQTDKLAKFAKNDQNWQEDLEQGSIKYYNKHFYWLSLEKKTAILACKNLGTINVQYGKEVYLPYPEPGRFLPWSEIMLALKPEQRELLEDRVQDALIIIKYNYAGGTVKKYMQAQKIPLWERVLIPKIFLGGHFLACLGL
ncbi:MAG: tRNA lysidine(34) synthetase TilS [Gammaproteobacteria bacterium]